MKKLLRFLMRSVILNCPVLALLAQPPSNVSVSPSSGTGLTETFAFTASSPTGYNNLAWIQVIIGSEVSNAGDCTLYVWLPGGGTAYLTNDSGSTNVGSAALGSSATLQNSQCSLNLAGSSVSGSGNNATLNLALTFSTGFLGTHNVYMYAGDLSGQTSNWQQMGTWTAPGATAPSAISFSPNSGSGNSGTFTATFTDTAGVADFEYMQIWFSAGGLGTSGANTCMLLLTHSSGQFSVLNDAGTAWQAPITPGQSDQNSQCVLNTANSGFTYSGNTATMTVNLTFKAGFAGTQGVWLWAENLEGEYAWSGQMGSWTVTGAGSPTGVSISPNVGSGSSQTFTANFTDPVSAANLQYLQMAISGDYSTAANNCSVLYIHAYNYFALSNDSGTWRPGFAPGGSDSNSQCTLTTYSPGASFSGDAASMTFAVTFTPAFVGTKQLYLWAENYAGQYPASQGPYGSWTVTNSTPVATPTISPTDGTYTSPQAVIISTTTSGASIIYTNDGTTPSQSNGYHYTGPFTVSSTTTIEAIAVESGMSSSGVMLRRITMAPSITSLSPTSGPVNTPVIISGSSFGAIQGGSSVTFNGVAANPTSWSLTTIHVPVPPGANTGNVVVTVNGSQAVSPQPFTISPPATPSATLVDLTQSGPYYFVGDSFTVNVTGVAGQPVSVIQNGVASGILGNTNPSGVYTLSGTWGASNAGAYAQVWSVGGVPAAPLVFEIIESSGSTDGPVSIPNSFTGGTPPLACADITGNWIATPSSGPTSEWDLTQSGNQVTGTVYVSNGPNCGVVTWTVSGNYVFAGGVPTHTLNAANPNPPIDGCGFQNANPDTHVIHLSGNSCSTGTGTWQHSGGAGSLQQQSKTTPNVVTSNKTTAHYQVSYAAYIPVDHIAGPTTCFYQGYEDNAVIKLYKGDANRGNPSLVGSGYRVLQSTVAIPGMSYVYNPYVNTGATRNYGFGSPANGTTIDSTPTTSDIYNGPYSGLDEDGTTSDCSLWNANGQESTAGMATPGVLFPYPTQAQVLFAGLAFNPLEVPAAGISWNMNVVVDESNPTAPTAYVNFNHTCYPAHTVKVNGVTIYDKQPAYNNIGYLTACLFQVPGFGKLTGVSTAVQVNTQ